MKTKNILLIIGVGAIVYFFMKKNKSANKMPEKVIQKLPTSSSILKDLKNVPKNVEKSEMTKR